MLPDVLRTEHLRCERFTLRHVDELAVLDSDPLVQATIFGKVCGREKTEERVRWRVACWADHGYGDYVARLRDGEFVGTVGIFPASRPGAIAIGYALRPAHWGRGYATELCSAVAAAIAAVRDDEIVATVLESNAASRRVLEKSGFLVVGPNADDERTLLYRLAR